MFTNFSNVVQGAAIGIEYTKNINFERQLKQGGDSIISSFFQFSQINLLAITTNKLIQNLGESKIKTVLKVACFVGPIFSLPFIILSGIAKSGNYKKFIKTYNDSRFSKIKLPPQLSQRTTQYLSLIAKHAGNIATLAIVVTIVGYTAMGNLAYGAGALVVTGYELLNRACLVPPKIAVKVELLMPTVSLFGMLMGGNLISKAICIFGAASQFDSLNKFIQHRVDRYTRQIFKIEGPTLQEMEAPVVTKELSYDEINSILKCEESDLELNPAHCSKSVYDLEKLPRSTDFNKFQALFDKIDLEKNYKIVLRMVQRTERFTTILLDYFHKNPVIKGQVLEKEALAKEIHIYTEIYLKRIGKWKNKEKFIADYVRNEMKGFVGVLRNKITAEGSQKDLSDARTNCSIILANLLSGKLPSIEKEDQILKLAIEGGRHCTAGVRRASEEIIQCIIQNGLAKIDSKVKDRRPEEIEILQLLINRRKMMVDAMYENMVSKLDFPEHIKTNTEFNDLFHLYFSLGFYPLTPLQRKSVNVGNLFAWQQYQKLINLYKTFYRNELKQILNDRTISTKVNMFIKTQISGNSKLSEEQKDDLILKFAGCDEDFGDFDEAASRFQNLLLVNLGVLRKKQKVDPKTSSQRKSSAM